MQNNINTRDNSFWDNFKALFKKPRVVKPGDIGVYYYIWTVGTINEDSHEFKYDVYAKVKAVEIFENLVEIESVGDVKINDSASSDIQQIIKNNFPKYVNPKYVKWQIKEQ